MPRSTPSSAPPPPPPPPPRLSSAERLGLAALAVGADLAWRLALLVPWAFCLVLGALWWQQTWAWWMLAGVLGLLAWALWPAPARDAGEQLTAAEAPGLFAELERLRASLALPRLHAVLLTDDLNAAVREDGPIWWPWAQRRTLLIGLPLLGLLDDTPARAVLAHELAHLSRRHGRLGHWLYRARLAWLALSEPLPADASAYERGVHALARRFAPWFAHRSLAHARACEREADAGAAACTSAAALVDALQWLTVGSHRLARWQAGPWQALKAEQPEPPADGWARALAALRAAPVSREEAALAWADTAAVPDDTHPPLAARAAALGVMPGALGTACAVGATGELGDAGALGGPGGLAMLDQDGPLRTRCAGAAWLADWPGALARAGARWQREDGPLWQAAHAWLRCCHARLAAGDFTPPLARAQALGALGRGSEALDVLAAAHASGDADPALGLALGEAWLRHGPAARHQDALALLESAVQADPGLARAARSAALEAPGLTEAERARLTALRDRAGARRAQAVQAADQRLTEARLSAPGLPADALAALDALCAALAPVRAAWLGRAEVASADGRPFQTHVLLVQAQLDALAEAGLDEERLAQPFAWLLSQARPSPADLVLVRVCFTTEQVLAGALAATPARAWRRPPAQAKPGT